MNRSAYTKMLLAAISVIAVLLGAWGEAAAGDYGNKDFSLRFPAALTRFSTFGDVAAAGGASAASKWSTAVNPASAAWLDVGGELGLSVCPQWNRLDFDNGTELDIFVESVTVDLDEYGTFVIGAAQIDSNRAVQRDGLDFRFCGDMYQAQWGKKFTEDLALGLAFNYTDSTVRNDLMTTIPIAKGVSDSYVFRLGALHQPWENWRAGLVLDYGWSSDRTAIYAVPALGLPAGTILDHTYQILVRPGVSYDYMKDGTVYLDYQFGSFWNDTGTLNVNRFYAGVDHGFTEWLFGRVGTTLDTEGGTAWTAGIGFYPTEWFSVDAAYQAKMFPEIKQEFGWSHTITVSLSFAF